MKYSTLIIKCEAEIVNSLELNFLTVGLHKKIKGKCRKMLDDAIKRTGNSGSP